MYYLLSVNHFENKIMLLCVVSNAGRCQISRKVIKIWYLNINQLSLVFGSPFAQFKNTWLKLQFFSVWETSGESQV